MISNVNQNLYMQTADVKRGGDVAKLDASQSLEAVNNRVVEIKKGLEEGSYKLMAPHILAKIFAEAELGV